MAAAGANSNGDNGRRWNDVLAATTSLFAERGYHGTTMRHIAEALGVRAPSLYNYVESKQELLIRIVEPAMDELLKVQEEAIASTDDLAEKIRRAAAAHVHFHIHNRQTAIVSDRELRNLEEPARTAVLDRRRRYERRFRDLIEEGVALGRFSVGSPKLASFAIIEMATSVVIWFREDGVFSEQAVAEQFGAMALRIVGADLTERRPAVSGTDAARG